MEDAIQYVRQLKVTRQRYHTKHNIYASTYLLQSNELSRGLRRNGNRSRMYFRLRHDEVLWNESSLTAINKFF